MKTVYVTGASEGIGKSIVKQYLDNGYMVILNGLDDEFMKATLKEFSCDNLIPYVKNLLDDDYIEGLKDLLEKEKLNIDILICNAAIQIEEEFSEISYESFEQTYIANVFRNIELTQLVIPTQIKNKWGRNIFIGSIHQSRPIYDMVTYASSKAALANMMKNLSFQFASQNLTFNSVAPGFVTTRRNRNKLENLDDFIETIPSKSTVSPEEVATVVYNLTLDSSKYINGAVIPIDGGASI